MKNNLHCFVCSKSNLKKISINHKLSKFSTDFILIECHSCGHVSIDNKPSDEQLNNYYKNEFWNEKKIDINFNQNWHEILTSSTASRERLLRSKKQFEYINSKLKLDKEIKIIDIGSGFAPILYNFSNAHYLNLYALEFDSNICKYLEKQNIKSINASIDELSKTSEVFDLIIISHTLEHIADPNKFLEKIKKISRKNTILFIEVPYKDYLEPFNENLHLNFFSKRSLSQSIKNIGFKVDNVNIDRYNVIDRIILKLLFFIYGRYFVRLNKSINKKSKIIDILHFFWRPIKRLLSSNINIHISRRDIRTISTIISK